jgi:hypothetical protein
MAAASVIATAASASVDGKNRKVSIVNTDPNAIEALYAWPTSGGQGFQQGMLNSPIGTGGSLTVDFDRGTSDCEFHLLAITHSYGYHQRDVDVCTTTKWIVEEKSNHAE